MHHEHIGTRVIFRSRELLNKAHYHCSNGVCTNTLIRGLIHYRVSSIMLLKTNLLLRSLFSEDDRTVFSLRTYPKSPCHFTRKVTSTSIYPV